VGRPHSTFASGTAVSDATLASVQFSQSIYLESDEGLRRMYLGEEIKLQFSIIRDLLTQSCDVLYFLDRTERTTFLLAYPELEGCAR
jgi:hypothetical protein